MVLTKQKHKRKLTKAYGDSHYTQQDHQPKRDEVFMDRDMFILHKDLIKIIELLEKK